MEKKNRDIDHEGREKYYVDIDRMINEGLGGGQVSPDNGLIDSTRPFHDEESNRTKQGKKER